MLLDKSMQICFAMHRCGFSIPHRNSRKFYIVLHVAGHGLHTHNLLPTPLSLCGSTRPIPLLFLIMRFLFLLYSMYLVGFVAFVASYSTST